MAYYMQDWIDDHGVPDEADERVENMTLVEALEEVLSAAESWDNEVGEYIFPALTGDDDEDGAQESYVIDNMIRERAMAMVYEHLGKLREEVDE